MTTAASDTRVLWRAFAVAFALEFGVLTGLGWQSHWLAHPQKNTGLDASKFVEAEVYKMPERAQLTAKVSAPAPTLHRAPEATLSKVPGQGAKSKTPTAATLEESNQTSSEAPAMAATHGPIAVFSPPPAIPAYLQNQDLKAKVVIEFLISAQGVVTPKLVGSSGNEELDAIAIDTAKKWQFRPAEQDHKNVDSKVRLRINFEVN